MLKKIVVSLLGLVLLAVVVVALFAFTRIRAYDASVAKVYPVPVPEVQRSTEEAVLARGKHLAESLGGCHGCHGPGLSGGKVESMGPLAEVVFPNVTAGKGAAGAAYSDGELARLIRHGIRRDGTTVTFMPSQDFNWWSDDDVAAVISYMRSLPAVDVPPGAPSTVVKPFGKFLDRMDAVVLDVARRIDHTRRVEAPAPSESAGYGLYVGKLCTGCHGETLSGGRIPGTPPEIPMPLNLTPHDTGLKAWSFADFEKLMREGVRKNGQKLNPFMPTEMTRNFSDVEMKALWAYLQKVPARPLGGR